MTAPHDPPSLLPCPFCGDDHARHEEGEFGEQVSCDPTTGCGAITDYYDTAEKAADAWNRRAAHPEAPPSAAGGSDRLYLRDGQVVVERDLTERSGQEPPTAGTPSPSVDDLLRRIYSAKTISQARALVVAAMGESIMQSSSALLHVTLASEPKTLVTDAQDPGDDLKDASPAVLRAMVRFWRTK